MDTIKNGKSNDTEETPVEEGAHESGTTAGRESERTEDRTPDAADGHEPAGAAGIDEDDDLLDEEELRALTARRAASHGVLAGAASLVGLGLALASVTGTWLGTVMSEREELIGQIKSQSGSAAGQIAAVYGTPWHTIALFNGVFALLAIIVAAAVLVGRRVSLAEPVAPWVSAVAWGALVLGVIGLVIAGAMWFDVFTSLPTVPTAPGGAGAGAGAGAGSAG